MSAPVMTRTTFTLPFSDPGCLDAREVGGKGKGLAEMTQAGLPVPPGFTVSAGAYREFLAAGDLRKRLAGLLARVDLGDAGSVERVSAELAELLAAQPLPEHLVDEISAAYRALCGHLGVPDLAVAVRSSATAEDSAADSFAGEFETWVDITGVDDVLIHVHRCYTSVFAGRVLRYALERGIDLAGVEMAVVVQKVVRARAAGVMFTLDPITGDRSRIVLESSWGLGLAVVGGEVTPDRFIVGKVGLSLREKVLGAKRVEYRDGTGAVPVEEPRLREFCLSDEEALALAALAKTVEKRHHAPQDIEFAVDEDLPDGENLLLLQCRPETVWSGRHRAPKFEQGAGLMSWITGGIRSAAAAATDAAGPETAPGHTHGEAGHDHG
ncbi:PEP/pyruvate-binding domain-containing protein [Streptomyces tagetis]|uniref:Phosphoenolpyruvate synthase n=1 Tax=Streptomyces tagetis TaxID=2820809 RepID=A0A941B1N2_9ACTN|nr:PEP/pyruvate-binding domain-containing protein [Streptomyces sp. RG38]MBQ0828236.1 PEP/pyruvate-binding domain-containing protein [Streptomyces sp. RG38]